jgi:hypothetical protein
LRSADGGNSGNRAEQSGYLFIHSLSSINRRRRHAAAMPYAEPNAVGEIEVPFPAAR